MGVNLCGEFISICDTYLIHMDKVLKWNKFDYIVDRKLRVVNKEKTDSDKYCILITQIDNSNEVIYFSNKLERDHVFSRIADVLKIYRRKG